MGRRVFFSFHYEEDIWRVNQVRNSRVTKLADVNEPIDKASWESIRRVGDEAVYKWINQQLSGVGVTVVLIGSQTATRKFVDYEVRKSFELGKGLLGIRIHNLENVLGRTSWPGMNPLDNVRVSVPAYSGAAWSITKTLSSIYPTYDWVTDDGFRNFPDWVEQAAQIAGR